MAPSAEFQKMMANTTPEDAKKGMEDWAKWAKENEKNIVDLGQPLGKTKRVKKDSTSDVKNDVGGYSIIQADSHEEAAKLFEGHGHFEIPGAWIEVMEIAQMPGM